jgi:hypothetical protein
MIGGRGSWGSSPKNNILLLVLKLCSWTMLTAKLNVAVWKMEKGSRRPARVHSWTARAAGELEDEKRRRRMWREQWKCWCMVAADVRTAASATHPSRSMDGALLVLVLPNPSIRALSASIGACSYPPDRGDRSRLDYRGTHPSCW